jgi:tetratricopeptide (TPR) repeat protein/tRNA A-37 threonylcarbamoyl transferase component Bud32
MLNKILVGRYSLLKLLSSGTSTETYLAEDIHLPDRPQCIVKQLRTQSLDPDTLKVARQLFQTEARVLDVLGAHERIPRLLAHFEENQQFYIVQECIEGQDLAQELSSGLKWNESQAIACLQDVLPILQFVHQQNTIHRDINPQNLIRRSDSQAGTNRSSFALIGFGAVKEITTSTTIQQVHPTPIGAPGYIPVEQIMGKPRFSSDIYALGMTIIYALTGTLPGKFPEDPQSGEIMWRQGTQVSDRTAAILDKMVRAHFRDRYQNTNEVIDDLNSLSQGGFAATLGGGFSSGSNGASGSNGNSAPNQTIWQQYRTPITILAGLAVLITTASISYFVFKPKENPISPLGTSTSTPEPTPTDLTGFIQQGNQRLEAGRYRDALTDFEAALKLDPNSTDALSGKIQAQASLLNIERKYQEALTEFEKAISIQPNSASTWVGKGNAFSGLRQYDEALKAYDRATQIKPDYVLGWTGRGATFNSLLKYDEALVAYEQATKVKPDSASAWVGYGDTLRFKLKYQEAIASYDQAIAISQNYSYAWTGKGLALNGTGQSQDAIAATERATKIDPKSAYAWWAWGALLNQNGRHEGALAASEKSLSLDDKYIEAWKLKSNSLLKLRKLPEALAAAEEGVRLDPNNVDTLTSKAIALYELGKYDQALPIYQKVVQINPNLEFGWSNLSELLNQMKRFNEALTAADRALKVQPNTSGWNQRANALVGLQRHTEAIAAYDQVLKLKPDYHYAHIGKGNAFYRLQRYQDAVNSYDQALAIQPVDRKLQVESDRFATLNLKGNALAQLQKYNEALETYQKATEEKADFPEGWFNQGRMLSALQRYNEALAAYDKALALKPDYADAKVSRAEVAQRLGQ